MAQLNLDVDTKEQILAVLEWARDYAKAKGQLHYGDSSGGHSVDIGIDDLYWLIETIKTA